MGPTSELKSAEKPPTTRCRQGIRTPKIVDFFCYAHLTPDGSVVYHAAAAGVVLQDFFFCGGEGEVIL